MRLFIIILVCILSVPAVGTPIPLESIPEPLKPWVDWVLYDEGEYQCPLIYSDHRQRRCAWPSTLELNLEGEKGSFSQLWTIYHDSWVTLPGDLKHWPQSVVIQGKPVTVVSRNNKPVIHLTKGTYAISGEFFWKRLPETLSIPADTGLINLKVRKKTVKFPELADKDHLWLRKADVVQDRQKKREQLEMNVFRRVIDDQPLRIITQIHLDVSGSQREMLLGRALLEGYTPLRLSSRLPARLEADGQLRVQLRPGRWTIELEARYPTMITDFNLPKATKPWPNEEIWVFQSMNHLRLVEVMGTSIDPRQTNLPTRWQVFPAYRMSQQDQLTLKVIRRGDPDPEPDKLNLTRNIWLDFDGQGYTFNDTIRGTKTRGWRLEVNKDIDLGRVDIDGQPQFITQLGESGHKGVEVRRGKINLTADSRYTLNNGILPASGWQQDFHNVSMQFHIPPGWVLFSATGMDNVPQTWLQRWSLLDLFLVLILSLSVMYLWNWRRGLFALIVLILIWHEPLAPQWAWVHILIAISLLRVVPEGKFYKIISWYRHAAVVGLILMMIPFAVQQVRTGLYPQLERPWQPIMPVTSSTPGKVKEQLSLEQGLLEEDRMAEPEALGLRKEKRQSSVGRSSYGDKYTSKTLRLQQIDPGATLQTGPGLPQWRWSTTQFKWNGPVEPDQSIKVILISPMPNAVLHGLRVVLMALLCALILGGGYRKGRGFKMKNPFREMLSVILLTGILFTGMPQEALAKTDSTTADFPNAQLLQKLKTRLLAAPECLPACAQIPRMRLDVSSNNLKIRLEVHANENVAIPLPAQTGQWIPQHVIVDGVPATSLYRAANKVLWLGLEKGNHQIVMSGALSPAPDLTLPLPLKPHYVTIKAKGWQVDGVHSDGLSDGQLQFTRHRNKEAPQQRQVLQSGTLPPFVRVERTIRLGLDWSVITRVVRASPKGVPIVMEVPLLDKESPTTTGVRVEKGQVLVNMSVNQSVFEWRSVIEKQNRIELKAPDTTDWVEVWRLDVSPIWHMASSGLDVVHHQDNRQNWLPEWRPWPGEQVALDITRPEGVKGNTLTIENSRLIVSPGKRADDYMLSLSVRSSQGGQHSIDLPEAARLQSVSINGQRQPIRQDGHTVTLPINPGKQEVSLEWREPAGIQMLYSISQPDLHSESTNTEIKVKLGRDRWILFANGPQMGPAVLYWGVVIVLVLIAIGLGRIPLTPLKTWQWFLLGIGLSQVSLLMAAFMVAWLMALGQRGRMAKLPPEKWFNALQVGLGVMTVIAVGILFIAIEHGLLGVPEMHVIGNGSWAYELNWYQDRSDSVLPSAWILSVPLYVYRLLMLAWAIWLAFALLQWLRWGWRCFSYKGLWVKPSTKKTDSYIDNDAAKLEHNETVKNNVE